MKNHQEVLTNFHLSLDSRIPMDLTFFCLKRSKCKKTDRKLLLQPRLTIQTRVHNCNNMSMLSILAFIQPQTNEMKWNEMFCPGPYLFLSPSSLTPVSLLSVYRCSGGPTVTFNKTLYTDTKLAGSRKSHRWWINMSVDVQIACSFPLVTEQCTRSLHCR